MEIFIAVLGATLVPHFAKSLRKCIYSKSCKALFYRRFSKQTYYMQ